MSEKEVHKENKFQGTIRPLIVTDLQHLKPILETWIRFPAITGPVLTTEVNETLDEMKKSAETDTGKKYYIAENPDGAVAGVMGYQALRGEMAHFAQTDNPAELINAYVDTEHRLGKGVGRALVQRLETEMKDKQYKEFLLNSGPRYEKTGWPFWTKMYGNPVGKLDNFYGQGFDAKVWRKIF